MKTKTNVDSWTVVSHKATTDRTISVPPEAPNTCEPPHDRSAGVPRRLFRGRPAPGSVKSPFATVVVCLIGKKTVPPTSSPSDSLTPSPNPSSKASNFRKEISSPQRFSSNANSRRTNTNGSHVFPALTSNNMSTTVRAHVTWPTPPSLKSSRKLYDISTTTAIGSSPGASCRTTCML